MSKTSDEALTSAVSELISVCEVIVAQSPSGGAGITPMLLRARAALAEINPPPKAPPYPGDEAEAKDQEAAQPAASHPAEAHPAPSHSAAAASSPKR